MNVKFGLWTFHELSKRQKIFDFIDFWLPLVIRKTIIKESLRCLRTDTFTIALETHNKMQTKNC